MPYILYPNFSTKPLQANSQIWHSLKRQHQATALRIYIPTYYPPPYYAIQLPDMIYAYLRLRFPIQLSRQPAKTPRNFRLPVIFKYTFLGSSTHFQHFLFIRIQLCLTNLHCASQPPHTVSHPNKSSDIPVLLP